MNDEEREMQNKKIRLITLSLFFGGVWAIVVIGLLIKIIENTAK